MKNSSFLKIIISLCIVGLGQPAWIGWLAPFAAAGGYAIFWDGLRAFTSQKRHFWAAVIWFAFVQAIQLSWMTSIEFQGNYILAVYAFLACCLGLQFGFLSIFVVEAVSLSVPRILALASLWTLIEWARFHVLCGFSWNPVGMALTSYAMGMQLASVGGILGLSFWVITTNLFAYRLRLQAFSPYQTALWAVIALFPYLYGGGVLLWHNGEKKTHGQVHALLVQPGLLPSQKVPIEGRFDEFISPWEQWRAIFGGLKPYKGQKIDLIALPESAVPFRSSQTVYDYSVARDLLIKEFGPESVKVFPELIVPFAQDGRVSNAFFSQFLANYFRTDFIIGMDEEDAESHCYSAALHFRPWNDTPNRYDKRVLVPLAEYLPFEWCYTLTKAYGVESFYTHGQEAKLFEGPLPLSVSICYEETFPNLIREGRFKGAQLFVNLTNDNWYPKSKLPRQHFDHGKLRAVENGVPTLRACNSGVTAAIDAFGCMVGKLDAQQGVLSVVVPTYHISTLYTFFGDSLVVGICFGFLVFYILFRRVDWLGRN